MAVTAILPVVLMTWLGVIDSRIICRSYLKVIFINVLDARVYVADITCVLQGLNYTGVGILRIGRWTRGPILIYGTYDTYGIWSAVGQAGACSRIGL